jgi:hypothetical protein
MNIGKTGNKKINKTNTNETIKTISFETFDKKHDGHF